MKLSIGSAPFPAGTSVGLYGAGEAQHAQERAQPGSAALQTQVVSAGSAVEFAGLDPDTTYFAAAQVGGAWSWVRLRTPASQAAQFSIDDAEDDILRGTSEGAEVVRIDGEGILHLAGVSTDDGPVALRDELEHEVVWLLDPTLPAVADPTGVADSTAAFQAAIARAAALVAGTNGNVAISGPPGSYKLSNLDVPAGVAFESRARRGGMRFTFPNDTGAPSLASLATNFSAGATQIEYSNLVGPGFLPSGTCQISGNFFSYTGLVVTSPTTGRFTGVTTAAGASGAGGGAPPSIVQGYAMTFAGGDYTALSDGIQVVGPGVGSRAAWNSGTPPNSLDGIFMGGNLRVDCMVTGFRHATAFTTDHQVFGSHFSADGCYSAIHAASPRQSKGNQIIEAGARLDGQFWACVYVSENNQLNVLTCGEQVEFGNTPWGFYKAGAPGSDTTLISDALILCPTFESMGLGLFGSEDGKASLVGVDLLMPLANYNPAIRPPGIGAAVGHFKCSLNGVHVRGPHTFFASPPPQGATFVSDSLQNCVFEGFTATAEGSLPICAPVSLPETLIENVRWDDGRLLTTDGGAIAAGDVVGWAYTFDAAKVGKAASGQQIAGVATHAAQNNVVCVKQRGKIRTNVYPGVAGAAVSNAGTVPVRIDAAHPGKIKAASSWYDTTGQVFGASYGIADDGTGVTIRLHGIHQ